MCVITGNIQDTWAIIANDFNGQRSIYESGETSEWEYIRQCSDKNVNIPISIEMIVAPWTNGAIIMYVGIVFTYNDGTTKQIKYFPQDSDKGPMDSDNEFLLNDYDTYLDITGILTDGVTIENVLVSRDEFYVTFDFFDENNDRKEGGYRIKFINNDDTLLSYDNVVIEVKNILKDYVCGICGGSDESETTM